MDAITLESACELIGCALNQPEFQESPESRAMIEDFLLASRVKAALASHERTKGGIGGAGPKRDHRDYRQL